MMKHILAGCSLTVLLAAGSLPAHAQTPSPAPSPAPASPAPASPAPAGNQEKVSPDELKKFATAVKQMLVIAKDAETQMSQAVQQTGLSEERFNQIYLAKKNPTSKPEKPITAKEQQSYDQAVAKLSQIEKDAQSKMDKTIVGQGLEVQRFNQIFATVQSSPQLRQEVQKMLQSQ